MEDVARQSPISWKAECMQDLLQDRRGSARVPMTAQVHWRNGSRRGTCRLMDMSPGGASFLVPMREVFTLGSRISLDVELGPTLEWQVTDRAEVVRRVPVGDNTCEVAVVFPVRSPKA